MEYFIVFFLLVLNVDKFEPMALTMANNLKFKSYEECVEFGYKQTMFIMESLNEHSIMYKDLMFKCVEEKKTRSMIDASLRGSHDLEKVIYELRKENDLLREEIQALEIKIKLLKEAKKEQYDELGY